MRLTPSRACTLWLLAGLFLWSAGSASATAIAQSSIAFGNLAVVPASGVIAFILDLDRDGEPDPWTVSAFAEAQNSLGERAQIHHEILGPGSLTVTADVTYATGVGGPLTDPLPPPPAFDVTGSASSGVNIPGCEQVQASALGRGTLINAFMLTGGTGPVSVDVGLDLARLLFVKTDHCGVLAETETIFSLEIPELDAPDTLKNEGVILFLQDSFLIGPNDERRKFVIETLRNTAILEFGVPYTMFLEVDSESRGINQRVPEPATLMLTVGGCIGLLLMAHARRRRARMPPAAAVFVLLLLSAFGPRVVEAHFLGANRCRPCQPGGCLESGGTCLSITNGNLQETYPVAKVTSEFGPTMALSLTYNSYDADGSRAQLDTGLGYGWTHSYNMFLFSQSGHMFRASGDGDVVRYVRGAGGIFVADPGYFETMVENADGSFAVTQKDGTTMQFAAVPATPFLVNGPVYRLTRVEDRNNRLDLAPPVPPLVTLTYAGGNLARLTDTYPLSAGHGRHFRPHSLG